MGGGGGGLGSIGGIAGGLMGGGLAGIPGALAGASVGQSGSLGGVSSMLGINNQMSAAGVPIQANTSDQQQTDQYGNVTQGIDQQQAFLHAIQSQGGLQNQSNTFNQLQGVANGTGPNPAQAQLAQATGANVANQAALMAGQRGAGANVGLIARQAAQQGASTQQQAAGQAATLQANQSLNALGAMGNLATSQANQQANATNALSNASQSAYGQVSNNISNQNNSRINQQAGINSVNAGVAAGNQQANSNLIGNITGGIGGALTSFLADGGKVAQAPKAHFDMGGGVGTALAPLEGASGPQSSAGKYFQSINSPSGMQQGLGPGFQSSAGATQSGAALGSAIKNHDWGGSPTGQAIAGGAGDSMGVGDTMMAAKGGPVQALVSKGETYLSPKKVEDVVEKGANPLKVGEKIPGKPQFPGNDYRNDTVKKTLQSGGFVIPNEIMQSKDAAKKASAFVAAHFKSQSMKKGK